MSEFDLIGRYFAPLASGFSGSLNLLDDAAIVSPPHGHELVITTDAICAGVHFIGNESPDLIARKLLRVNLSDLAAKGATPLCYFLTLMLPADTSEEWIATFASGLAADQQTFNIHLAGGDTTAAKGPANFSLTAIGTVPQGTMLRRSGAKQGDHLYVSGTLGESTLGLAAIKNGKDEPHLINRYLLPEPRLTLGQQLRGVASSAMDISDGLVQDLGHICKASGVGATIECCKLPVSTPVTYEAALSGGDDYELLFTSPQLLTLKGITRIGTITQGNSVTVLDVSGKVMKLEHKGYQHF